MTTTHVTSTINPGRKANIVLWTLQALLAAAFLVAAYTKLAATPQAVEGFNQIGLGTWFMYFIGAVELAGAIGLLIPVLSGLAGLGLSALLVGAAILQFTFEPVTALIPAAYLVPVAIIAWGRRQRTVSLLRLVTRPRG